LSCAPPRSERIERAGFNQALDRGPVALRWIDAAREIKQAPERPAGAPGRFNRAAAWPPAAFDRRESEHDAASATAKSATERLTSGGSTSTFIRRQSSKCSTSESFFLKFRSGMSPDSSAGHELDRPMGLQIGGIRRSRGVGVEWLLVEAVRRRISRLARTVSIASRPASRLWPVEFMAGLLSGDIPRIGISRRRFAPSSIWKTGGG